MKIIITTEVTTSEPFTIGVGKAVTLLAKGLQGNDYAIVDIVVTSTSGPQRSECCPGEVALPEVTSTVPLRCRNGARAILTATHPWLVLDAPQDVELRVRVVADPVSVVTVSMGEHKGESCATCQCVEPWAASVPLVTANGRLGFAFAPSDLRDPEATVAYTTVSGGTVYLFPTPRPGANVLVDDGGIIGYAANEAP